MLLNKYTYKEINQLYQEMNRNAIYLNANNSVGPAEPEVYKWLDETLGEDYVAIHNFKLIDNWTRQIDFLLFNPRYGYIICEVKSEKKITSQNFDDGISQEQQALEQNIAVFRYLNDVLKCKDKKQFVSFLVLYWNVSKKNMDDASIEIYNIKLKKYRNKVFIKDDVENVSAKQFFDRYFEKNLYGCNENGYNLIKESDSYNYKEQIEQFCKICEHKYEYRDKLLNENSKIEVLTYQQKNIFDYILQQENECTYIEGSAGTGKTFLGIYLAKYFMKKNLNVEYLFLTHKFSDYLKENFNDVISDTNFNLIIYGNNKEKYILRDLFKFNVIIIDEAQDINNKFKIEIIKKSKELHIKLIILSSHIQNSFCLSDDENDIINNIKTVNGSYQILRKNCRNVEPIAELIKKIENGLFVNEDIQVVKFGSKDDVENKLIDEIDSLLDQGVNLSDIVILTQNCCNKYNKIINKYGDIVTSINKFKGCEKLIVFIIDTSNLLSDKTELYIALSRAKVKYYYYRIE